VVTKKEAGTPEAFIQALDEPRRSQVRELHELIRKTAPDLDPYLRSGMLAYGTYRYRYDSGREGEWCRIGLASIKPRSRLHVLAADDSGYLAEAYTEPVAEGGHREELRAIQPTGGRRRRRARGTHPEGREDVSARGHRGMKTVIEPSSSPSRRR
jgi:hypothetical protein